MEESLLYDLLEKGVIDDWRREAEKEACPLFVEREKAAKAELLRQLPEESKDLLCSYQLCVEDRMDELHYNLRVKILNLGIRLGIDIQKLIFQKMMKVIGKQK